MRSIFIKYIGNLNFPSVYNYEELHKSEDSNPLWVSKISRYFTENMKYVHIFHNIKDTD